MQGKVSAHRLTLGACPVLAAAVHPAVVSLPTRHGPGPSGCYLRTVGRTWAV